MQTLFNTLFLKFLVMLFVALFAIQANAVCNKVGGKLDTSNGAATPVNDVGGDAIGNQCNDTPDQYSITFHRMSLCTANPLTGTNPDFTSCEDMLAEGNDKTVLISKNAETNFSAPDFDITPGDNYGYMVARLSARLGIKHSFTATTAVDFYLPGGGDGTAGIYCWTVNETLTGVSNEVITTPFGDTVSNGASGRSNMNCSNNTSGLSMAEFSYEVVNVNHASGCPSFDAATGDKITGFDVGNGTATSMMMKNATTIAAACTEVTSIFWLIALDEPYVITENSNFLMNFRTTESVSIDFDSIGVTEPTILKVGANPIQAFLTVTEPTGDESIQ